MISSDSEDENCLHRRVETSEEAPKDGSQIVPPEDPPVPFHYLPFLVGDAGVCLGQPLSETRHPFQYRTSANEDAADIFEDVTPREAGVLMLVEIRDRNFVLALSDCAVSERDEDDPSSAL